MIAVNRVRNVSIMVGEPTLLIPPARPAVSFDEVKAHLRISGDEEVIDIHRLIAAAISYVENYTGLALITQTWEERLSVLPDVIGLSKRPVQSIESVDDLTSGSPFTPLDPAAYIAAGIGGWRHGATVRPATSWPSLVGSLPEPARVVYVAGFGDLPEDVPEMIRHAVILTVGTWYDNRQAPVLDAVHALLFDWRRMGIA